jgi:hypothetical protein
VQRWQEDVSRISYEVIEMHHNRNVYRTVTQIAVDNGGLPPSAFFLYLNATYGVTQVAAVRNRPMFARTRSPSPGCSTRSGANHSG